MNPYNGCVKNVDELIKVCEFRTKLRRIYKDRGERDSRGIVQDCNGTLIIFHEPKIQGFSERYLRL